MPRFYSLEQRDGRIRFRRPDGSLEFGIGLNHIDSAALRYPDSDEVWSTKYENNQLQWLESVGEDLRSWGFSMVGWVQEVVVINDHYHRHSRNFIREEYNALGMPYCHMLPFTDSHQWEDEVRLPDIMHTDFEEWCDYVARDHCARLSDDPNLVGYFYSDCPVWTHTRRHNRWRGTLLRPWIPDSAGGGHSGERRTTDTAEIAERYYRVTAEAVRRYDPNHLILGDRFEANAPLPDKVLDAAVRHVDVLSFQCFGSPAHIYSRLSEHARRHGAPVLLADAAGFDPHTKSATARPERVHDVTHYRTTMERLLDIPQCVGYHLCGAFIKNRTRRYGLKDHRDEVLGTMVDGIASVNRWVNEHA